MAIERGQVQEVGATANGKPFLKIGGKKYFAGRCDVSTIKAGQMIEFEWNEFGEPHPKYGRSRGLQAWAAIPASNGHAATSSALDDADRPAISNWVAHAIQAGLIKAPEELEKWAVASQAALRAVKGEKPQPRTTASSAPPQKLSTDYEERMPEGFYDGPPPNEPPRGTRTW